MEMENVEPVKWLTNMSGGFMRKRERENFVRVETAHVNAGVFLWLINLFIGSNFYTTATFVSVLTVHLLLLLLGKSN